MSAPLARRRQIAFLKQLATRSGGRLDANVPLAEVAPKLEIEQFAGGTRFVDKDNPQYEGGSDPSYDLNCLLADGLIGVTYLGSKQTSLGGIIREAILP